MEIKKSYKRDGRAPIPVKEITSKVMSANKAKNTKPELALKKALWAEGIKGYRLNWKKVPGRPDIAFPGRKLAIFVHGCFWHRCPKCNLKSPKSNIDFWNAKFNNNLARDATKSEQLTQMGWTVLIIWECDIKNNLKNTVDNLKKHNFNF